MGSRASSCCYTGSALLCQADLNLTSWRRRLQPGIVNENANAVREPDINHGDCADDMTSAHARKKCAVADLLRNHLHFHVIGNGYAHPAPERICDSMQ